MQRHDVLLGQALRKCNHIPIKNAKYADTVAKQAGSAKGTANPIRKNGKATVKRLLDAGREELQMSGPINFRLDRVLKLAKVSPSSLYHHFGNRDGLLTALEFERSYADMMREMEMLRAYIASTDDPEALFKATELTFSLAGKSSGRERRQHRVETLAAASRNPVLRAMLADAQREGSAIHAEIIQMALQKRRETPNHPIDGISYVVQSLLVGRILVDMMDDDDLGKAWEETAIAAVRAVITGSR